MFTDFVHSWGSIPFAEGQAKYTLEDLDPYARYELFEGDVPSVFRVHAGDVTVDGPVRIGATDYDDVTMHIIEGCAGNAEVMSDGNCKSQPPTIILTHF